MAAPMVALALALGLLALVLVWKPKGSTGPEGLDGPSGIQGIQGLQGPTFFVRGNQGAIGLQGAQGPQGLQGYVGFPGPYINWSLNVSSTGPQGPQSASVSQVDNSATLDLVVPTQWPFNVPEDPYVVLFTTGPIVSASALTSSTAPYTTTFAIEVPAAARGATGPTGPSGASIPGPTGPTGAISLPGPIGPTGPIVTGPQGPAFPGYQTTVFSIPTVVPFFEDQSNIVPWNVPTVYNVNPDQALPTLESASQKIVFGPGVFRISLNANVQLSTNTEVTGPFVSLSNIALIVENGSYSGYLPAVCLAVDYNVPLANTFVQSVSYVLTVSSGATVQVLVVPQYYMAPPFVPGNYWDNTNLLPSAINYPNGSDGQILSAQLMFEQIE